MKHVVLAIAAAIASCAMAVDVFCWKVSVGDSIWVDGVSGRRKVRMVDDIDAPEMNQPYGPKAAYRLAELSTRAFKAELTGNCNEKEVSNGN